MRQAKRLAHGWRAGVLVKPGLALDHAAMMSAALALHEAREFWSRRPCPVDYLADATGFADAMESLPPRSGERAP